MKGTEKQIKWAQDIIEALENALEETKADPRLAAMPEAQVNEMFRRTAELVDIIRNADYAGDVIDVAGQAAKKHGDAVWGALGAAARMNPNPLAKQLKAAMSKPL